MSAKIIRAPRRRRKSGFHQVLVKLDDQDKFVLKEASRIEKLTQSDVIRRALRAYYKKVRQTENVQSIAS